MGFWDNSTIGRDDGARRPGFWDDEPLAGPSAGLYQLVRIILFVALVAVASGCLWLGLT